MSASSAISTKRRKIEEGDSGSKTKVETENVEKEFAPKPGMLLLVFGVPEDVNKKGFRHVACKVVRKAQVELLKEDNPLCAALQVVSPPGRIFQLTAPSRKDIAKLVAALDGATTHSLGLRKPKEEDGDSGDHAVHDDAALRRKHKLVVRRQADVTDPTLRKKKCRVIIRNLSFLATEANIADKLSKFGPLVEVSIPTVAITVHPGKGKRNKGRGKGKDSRDDGEQQDDEGNNQETSVIEKQRSRGFAFATFLCEKDADAAVKGSSGLRVCNREVAVDFSMQKEVYKKVDGANDAKEESDAADGDDGGKDGADEDEEDGIDKEDMDEGDKDDDSDDDSAGDDDHDEGDGDDAKESDDEEDDEKDGDGDDDQEKSKKKEELHDVEEGCTVFIRDLPFDAEPRDLKIALGKFGKIAMALIVKDKDTGMSRGCAFVKFVGAESAAKCVEAAKTSSVAGASSSDGAATGHGGLTVKDRVCRVDLAVDRAQAEKLKEDNKNKKGGKDKRNLYLANEGLVIDQGDESTGMSEEDKQKRQRAQMEKKKKLQNPLFFVSANRLSVRNLSKKVSDKEFKELCIAATKKGLSKKLAKDQDQLAHMLAQGVPQSGNSTSVPPFQRNSIKTAKVMLDLNRVRAGLPQSRGYGFVEFTNHAHALACLRELNNSAAYSSSASSFSGEGRGRLIVEFALENMRKVMILQQREERAKSKMPAKRGNDSSADDAEAPKNKKQKTEAGDKNKNKAAAGVSTGGGSNHDGGADSGDEGGFSDDDSYSDDEGVGGTATAVTAAVTAAAAAAKGKKRGREEEGDDEGGDSADGDDDKATSRSSKRKKAIQKRKEKERRRKENKKAAATATPTGKAAVTGTGGANADATNKNKKSAGDGKMPKGEAKGANVGAGSNSNSNKGINSSPSPNPNPHPNPYPSANSKKGMKKEKVKGKGKPPASTKNVSPASTGAGTATGNNHFWGGHKRIRAMKKGKRPGK